jgi:acarbose 7IV-phosphotransferase
VAGAHACTVPSTQTDAITSNALLARVAHFLNREEPGTRLA